MQQLKCDFVELSPLLNNFRNEMLNIQTSYVLIDSIGEPEGKYLARGHDIQTERSEKYYFPVQSSQIQ